MASGSYRTMVNVPPQYVPLVQEMSQSTGIPADIVAAQGFVESGFKANAQSSAGALGWMQFLPSTYNTYAPQAGVQPGTEFNPLDESKVYDVYMRSLLQQESGDVRNALAAYNAGPGNVQAGLPYADKIMQLAHDTNPPPTVPTTGFPNPLGGLLPTFSISMILGNLFGDMRDILERLGLILLGAALILLGIHILSGGQTLNIAQQAAGSGSAKGGATKTGASEAIEAAAVA